MWVLAVIDPALGVYLNYGVLGATVILLIFGKIVPGIIYEKAEQRHERELAVRDETIEKQEAEIRRLNETFSNQVIPALIAFTEVTRDKH